MQCADYNKEATNGLDLTPAGLMHHQHFPFGSLILQMKMEQRNLRCEVGLSLRLHLPEPSVAFHEERKLQDEVVLLE